MTCLLALFKIALALLMSTSEPGLPDAACRPGAPARAATVLVDRQLVLFTQDGTECNLALVSTGRPGLHATPRGEYSALYRRRAPMSSRYNVRMPFWICIVPSGELGLHLAPGNSAIARLGTPLSHGCIRLGRNTARWAYNWLTDGSAVSVR